MKSFFAFRRELDESYDVDRLKAKATGTADTAWQATKNAMNKSTAKNHRIARDAHQAAKESFQQLSKLDSDNRDTYLGNADKHERQLQLHIELQHGR